MTQDLLLDVTPLSLFPWYQDSWTALIEHNTVMVLTITLEAQCSAAQTKVEALEGMLQAAEEALKAKNVQEEEAKKIARQEVKEEEQKVEKASLTDMLAEWKKSVEGQWSHRS